MAVHVTITLVPKKCKRCQLAEPSLPNSLLINQCPIQVGRPLQGLPKVYKSKKRVKPTLKKDFRECNQKPNRKTSKRLKKGKK